MGQQISNIELGRFVSKVCEGRRAGRPDNPVDDIVISQGYGITMEKWLEMKEAILACMDEVVTIDETEASDS